MIGNQKQQEREQCKLQSKIKDERERETFYIF
jgi:hypothetical protein